MTESERSRECSWTNEDAKALSGLIRSADREPNEAWAQLDTALSLRSGACYRAQVLGTKAQIANRFKSFAEADATLDEACDIAGSCSLATLDLKRRRGILRAKEGRDIEALHLLNEALQGYEAMQGGGHDPDGNGVANCLFARGEPLLHMSDFEAAAADWRQCLTLFSRVHQKDVYVYSLINLANALRSGGLQYTRELKMARKYFRGTRKASLPRAVYYWLEGRAAANLPGAVPVISRAG